MTYDVAIIGAGTAGVYAAYELLKLKPHLKIVVLEMGQDIYHRVCPIVAGKVKECISCKPCSIMSGFGGRMNRSDYCIVPFCFSSARIRSIILP